VTLARYSCAVEAARPGCTQGALSYFDQIFLVPALEQRKQIETTIKINNNEHIHQWSSAKALLTCLQY
jgi:hypothetical protein